MQQQPPQPHQPYSSSESIPSEQQQAYPPLQPAYLPGAQRRDSIVYANRKQVIGYSVLQTGVSLFLISVIIFLFSLFTIGSPFKASEIALIVIPLVIMFAGLTALCSWVAWSLASLVYPKPKPVLIINSEGIIASKMPMQRAFFIRWAEINTMYSTSYGSGWFLCIEPKNADQFLRRFPPLGRFLMRLNSKLLRSSPYIHVGYLEQSVLTIIDQMRSAYRTELNDHHIQLRY